MWRLRETRPIWLDWFTCNKQNKRIQSSLQCNSTRRSTQCTLNVWSQIYTSITCGGIVAANVEHRADGLCSQQSNYAVDGDEAPDVAVRSQIGCKALEIAGCQACTVVVEACTGKSASVCGWNWNYASSQNSFSMEIYTILFQKQYWIREHSTTKVGEVWKQWFACLQATSLPHGSAAHPRRTKKLWATYRSAAADKFEQFSGLKPTPKAATVLRHGIS